MVKIAHLDDAFSECFELEATPVEGHYHCSKEKRKGEKEKVNQEA